MRPCTLIKCTRALDHSSHSSQCLRNDKSGEGKHNIPWFILLSVILPIVSGLQPPARKWGFFFFLEAGIAAYIYARKTHRLLYGAQVNTFGNSLAGDQRPNVSQPTSEARVFLTMGNVKRPKECQRRLVVRHSRMIFSKDKE